MKSSEIRRYMREARNDANESYLHADGFIDDMNFTEDDRFFGAEGGGNGNGGGAQTSQPYIINITNASDVDATDFDVLGSFEYLRDSNFNSNGDLEIDDVTVSSGIPDVTYQEMLYQFQVQPFRVGLTYLQSASSSQVLETFSVNTRDGNGNLAQKTLVPTIDPYQQQSDIIAFTHNFSIDGFTKLRFSRILADTSVRVQFYPAENLNLARALGQKPVTSGYGNPRIVRDNVTVLKG